MTSAGLVILAVADDPHDIFFIQQAAEKMCANHLVIGLADGQEATQFFLGEGRFADRSRFPMPDVLLTDLNMPGMSGFELLQWIHDHPQYLVVPTIVLSGSALDADIREAYRLGATSFITKPIGLNNLVKMLQAIQEYWALCECPRPKKVKPH